MFQIEDLFGALLKRYVPGYRSGSKWKRAVASLGYLLFTALLISGMFQPGTLQDRLVFLAQMLFGVSVPFVVLTNFLNIRSHLPLFKRDPPPKGLTAVVIVVWLMLSCLFIALTNGLHSPDYLNFLDDLHQLGVEEWAQTEGSEFSDFTPPADWSEPTFTP